MEFDLSKENIQPLRGGRNVSQLEIALQAQTNETFQRELLQQKTDFEYAIQHYDGEDPLENWYQYIFWVEQSYPKHGHEGNFIPLLEDCLAKFEHDKRYENDFRFCKLWIKYNDLQENPLELYQMMHARGICRGCADLYRAWAFYHEAAGDFRNADAVFNIGKQQLAQPYEELQLAHQNMIYAAGQQLISGVNEQRLLDERHALTTLTTFRSGKVGSVRVPSSSGAGILPSAISSFKSNTPIPIFEDGGDLVRGAEAAPISILTAAKRQVAPKENTIKPGAWTAAGPHWKATNVHHGPKFTVHEDTTEVKQKGLIIPLEFFPVTHEDFTKWKLMLCYPEPEDPSRIPMYPKSRVYTNNEVEFSIEEIRACRYIKRPVNRLNVSHVETEQAIQSILGESNSKPKMQGLPPGDFYNVAPLVNQNSYEHHAFVEDQHAILNADHSRLQQACGDYSSPVQQQNAMLYVNSPHISGHISHEQQPEHYLDMSQNYHRNVFHLPQQPQQSEASYQPVFQHNMNPVSEFEKPPSRTFGQNMVEQTFFNASPHVNKSPLQNQSGLGNNLSGLWRSDNEDSFTESVKEQPRPNIVSKFTIYEESNMQENLQLKGSAMRSTPFKILSDEDLAETGSRGGHDIAAAAQPGDGAKRIEIFEDDSSSSFSENAPTGSNLLANLNNTCNTQAFNFNLNAMQVSTPQPKQSPSSLATHDECNESARKQLFGPKSSEKQMSTIFEETHRSSSCSGSTIVKSSTFSHSKRDNMAPINENNSYHFNLEQNLKANAALRNSALLELMDCDSAQSSPVSENAVLPLVKAPSNPFKPALLKELLKHIGFPSRHLASYITLNSTPRISVRKEVISVGEDKYVVDKCLGKGTYGQVYKAADVRRNRTVALKTQKPPHLWEFYICNELQKRLSDHPFKERFMDIYIGYFNDQVSIFASEYSPFGSLLGLVNSHKQRNQHPLNQVMVIYFCIEMLKIISVLHQAKIIHADIKPDNFLVYILSDGTLQLQLIDFGASIDMSLFPPDTSFTRRVTTKDFVCCEMLDGRPWNYHTDLFCVAATAHVLLFNNYLQMQKKDGCEWAITQRFTRYMRTDIWNTFFNTLLNQQKGPANAEHLILFLTDALHSFGDKLNEEMRKLINVLNNQ